MARDHGSRARRCALVAAALLCLRATPAAAQQVERYIDKPVATVRMELEGRTLEDQALLDLVDTRVGQPLRMADVRETIAHLHGLGRFQNVEVHATLNGSAGVDLVYDLIPLHAVRAVIFRGPNLGLSENVLRDFVRDRFGGSPTVGRAAEAARSLTALLHERGFLNARVTPDALVEHAPERTTLIFQIDAGPRARIGTVRVAGAEPPGRPSVTTRGALRTGAPFDRPRIDAELARHRDDLKSLGFYQARVDDAPRVGPDGLVVDLDIAVDAGPRIEVVFAGDPVPVKQRAELVPIGREGSVDEDLLEDSKARIEGYFQAQGYKDAAVTYAWSGDEARRQLVFTVTRGERFRVHDIEFAGNRTLTARDLDPLVRLERGAPFVDATLAGDLARIADTYRQRGYPDVKVDRVLTLGPPTAATAGTLPVRVEIQIAEGPRAVVRTISFAGNQALTAEQLAAAIVSRAGSRYYASEVGADRERIVERYLDRGFADVTVEAAAVPSGDRTQVDVQFKIAEGPQIVIDHILIVGNNRTSRELIANELTLREGQPLGVGDVVESQRRISALGLFRRVRITELAHRVDDRRRDLLVTVEEAPLTTYGFGGGVEGGQQTRSASGGDTPGQAEQVFQVAPRGFFEIGRRNLWGRNRTVNLFTRVTVRPRNRTTSADPTAPQGGYGFNEYRVLGTLREPKIFDTGADALVTGFVEQGVRSSFNFARRAIQSEVARRIRSNVSVLGRYSFERAKIFDARYDQDQKPQIDRYFSQVRLSSFSGALVRDTRDDALDPSRGVFTSVESMVAARRIGSEVGFVRTFVQGFVFKALPWKRRAIFAGAARLGLASGFPRDVVLQDEQGDPVIDANGQRVVVTVRDIPPSERFFTGGATTVRGFGLDLLGTPETIDKSGFPLGGDALLVFNAELRIDVRSGVSVAGFLDAGNVFPRPGDVRVGDIRPAGGFGLRYKSPLGPLRFDIGFNLDRRRVGGKLEDGRQYFLTLGQAF